MDTTSEINRQLLECPVCCENYNDDARVPRAILCGHSFCTTCLKKMLRDKNITCPLCQAVHAVRDGDVNSIPKDNTRRHLMDILNKKCTRQICTQCEDNNKAVKFCQDCEEYICNECTNAHKRTKLTKNHKLMALEQDKDTNLECNSEVEMKPVLCKNEKHGNKQVLLFCLNCSEDICENCAKERHKEHQIKQLKELYSEKRKELNVLISGITQADLQNVTKRLEEKIEEVKEKGMSLKSGLTRQFETYGEIIADRLNEIKSQVDEAFGNVTKGLENDKDLVWNMQRKLSEADVLTHERNPASFLKSSQCMVETLTDLQRKISKLPEVVEVRFSQACTTEDFQKIVHALGSIQELRQENSDVASGVTRENISESSSIPSLPYESSQRGQLMEVLKSLTVSDAGENPRSELSHRSSKLDASEVKHSSNKETFTIEDLNKPFGKDIPNPSSLIERNIPKGRRELLRSEWVKNMASLRFQTWGLKGYWRVDDDKVEMFGRSSEETEQCMCLLKETVLERTLKLRKGSEFIVESDKWQLITGNLKKKYPDQVQFEVKHEDREVVIYSTCTIILKDSCDAIRIFLRDNEMKMIKLCYDEPVITFITKNKSKLKKIRNCLSQYCLEISLVDNTKLLLKGIGYGVGQALKMVHALASKYDAKLTEENRFDSDNEEEDDVERFSDEEKADSDIAVQMYLDVGSTDAVLRALCFPGDDRLIYVVAGDITDLPVEALVNAADKTLKHNGGLAKALVEKGGRSIQEECTFHVQRSGNVQVGQVYCSDAGTMSCSVIIHAVGPIWTDGKSNEEEKLFECITNCLKSASRLKLGSVAFPAISAGSYKFPTRDATFVIVKAVKDFLLQEPRCSIREIYLCDKALSTADEFTMALTDSFDNEDIVVSDAKQITKTSEHVKSESERYDVRQLLFI